MGPGDPHLLFQEFKDAVEITIPKLNEMAYEQVELASVPFLTFVANKGLKDEAANYSFVLRGYVRHWLGNVWAEYDRIKLNDIVATGGAPGEQSAGSGRQPLLNMPRAGLSRDSCGEDITICGRLPSTLSRRPARGPARR